MCGGCWALPEAFTLTFNEGRSMPSTAWMTKCTKSSCGIQSRRSGGNNNGWSRSTDTNRVFMAQSLTDNKHYINSFI